MQGQPLGFEGQGRKDTRRHSLKTVLDPAMHRRQPKKLALYDSCKTFYLRLTSFLGKCLQQDIQVFSGEFIQVPPIEAGNPCLFRCSGWRLGSGDSDVPDGFVCQFQDELWGYRNVRVDKLRLQSNDFRRSPRGTSKLVDIDDTFGGLPR